MTSDDRRQPVAGTRPSGRRVRHGGQRRPRVVARHDEPGRAAGRRRGARVASRPPSLAHLGPHCSAMLMDLMYGAAGDRGTAAPSRRRRAGSLPSTGSRSRGSARWPPPRSTARRCARRYCRDDIHALKFFLFWHPDQPAGAPTGGGPGVRRGLRTASASCRCWRASCSCRVTDPRFDDSLLAAAAELGAARPDVYKTQAPTLGRAPLRGDRAAQRRAHRGRCGRPGSRCPTACPRIASPTWSTAVCRGGASGFLAGRASWSRAVDQDDPAHELADRRSGAARRRSPSGSTRTPCRGGSRRASRRPSRPQSPIPSCPEP